MPYDRKTELLWNYLSLAQLSDLTKIWGQGPAHASGGEPPDGSQTQTIVLRTDDATPSSGATAPIHSSDQPMTAASDSPVSHQTGMEELGNLNSHISVAPYIAPHASPASSVTIPDYGGTGYGHSTHTVHVVTNTVSTTTTVEHTTVVTPPPAAPEPLTVVVADEPVDPKFYGPSEVHASGAIESAANTQSSDVITTMDTSLQNGWSNVGADQVGNIIAQLQTAGEQSAHNFVIDYVHGDMTSLTTVHQLNTVFDNDINAARTSFSAPEGATLGDNNLAQSVTSGGNSSGNTSVMHGNADTANYDVLVVTGDLTKVNKIMQVNLIDDTDHNTVNAHADISTPYGTASSVWEAAIHSGGNTEVNIGFIIDNNTGSIYLVGGTYGTFASATQLNILSNADLNDILNLFHSQEGTGFLGFSTDNVIQSGGDSQSNLAGFLGDSENPSSTSGGTMAPSDLTSLLAFANLHPTQEDGNIHVLFIDGNYTIINLVVQINVIHDADYNTLDAGASGATGALTPPPVAEPEDTSAVDTSASPDGTTGDPTSPDDTTGSDETAHASDTDNPSEVHTESTGNEADHTATADTVTATETAPATETPLVSDTTTEPPASNDNHVDSGADTPLPVYVDHSSLNYDQIATSGDNSGGNHATIIDGGNGGPQITIVQGHYYEYNEIYQVNILIDSDHNTITSAMNVATHAGGDHTDGVQDTSHLISADDILKSMTG